jgi:hypothetical protein
MPGCKKTVSAMLALALVIGAGASWAEEMPLPPSVAQDLAQGKSAGPSEAAPKARTAGKKKSAAKRGKTKVDGSIETDERASENMATGTETPSAMPTISPSGGAGLNFRF